MSQVTQFFKSHYAEIVTVLFLLSELLAVAVPSIKANSVFQLIWNLFKSEAKKESQAVTNEINQ